VSRYLPIDCGLHSEYELLAMHRETVELCCVDEQGMASWQTGVVRDVFTRNAGEYLRLDQQDGGHLNIRLDRIRKIRIK